MKRTLLTLGLVASLVLVAAFHHRVEYPRDEKDGDDE